MQRSANSYIILYAVALTVISGAVLALTAEGLRPLKYKNEELDRKKSVLGASFDLTQIDNVATFFDNRVNAFVINFQGEKVDMPVKDVVVAKQYKYQPEDRLYPVYEIKSEDGSKVESVVLPVYGFGLWDNIWGFVALEDDLNTIKGVVFQHAGETPGLGARIASDEIQNRYKGKKIFDAGKLVSVTMLKGEGNEDINAQHEVDGMSGATITAVGLNNMLEKYFSYYKNYIQANKK